MPNISSKIGKAVRVEAILLAKRLLILYTNFNPSDTGFSAPTGSIILQEDGSQWRKAGEEDTNWKKTGNQSDIDANVVRLGILESVTHEHSNKLALDGIANYGSGSIITTEERTKLGDITPGGDGHIHDNYTIIQAITSAGSNNIITTLERNNLHTHSNKTELDKVTIGNHDVISSGNPHSVTKIEINLGDVPNLDTTDAVNNEHIHINKTELDKVTVGDHDIKINNPHSVTAAQAGAATSAHAHISTDITDFAITVTSHSDVSANTSARHTHTNKSILDAINDASGLLLDTGGTYGGSALNVQDALEELEGIISPDATKIVEIYDIGNGAIGRNFTFDGSGSSATGTVITSIDANQEVASPTGETIADTANVKHIFYNGERLNIAKDGGTIITNDGSGNLRIALPTRLPQFDDDTLTVIYI